MASEMSGESGLLGEHVSFPLDHAQWEEGKVINELPDGTIIVETEDGFRWKGCEHQVLLESI